MDSVRGIVQKKKIARESFSPGEKRSRTFRDSRHSTVTTKSGKNYQEKPGKTSSYTVIRGGRAQHCVCVPGLGKRVGKQSWVNT